MVMQPETKEAYQAKVKAQLDKLNAKIDELKAKAAQAKADAAIEYHGQMEELYTKRETAQMKLQEVQDASGEAWEEMKAGVETAWTELQRSFEKATSKFK
jgi:ABC-type Zn uptake system ZnuABC Zn-binding protein ZnuA